MSTIPMLQIKNLNKTFHTPQGPMIVLKEIDLKVNQGEFITIIGTKRLRKKHLIKNNCGFGYGTYWNRAAWRQTS